jgi:hypothetical protein
LFFVPLGTTETGGLSSNGSISGDAELRLIDCPQLGYLTSDKPFPRGEILAHTPRMVGYFDQQGYCADGSFSPPSTTSEEWMELGGRRYFRTGDVGELVGKGEIKIIDRCKSHFKLAQGVFVAPEPLEQVFMECDKVGQIFVYGDGYMQACVAVVSPSSRDDDALSLLAALHALGKKHGLRSWEIPQRVVVAEEPFSEANGLLSPGGKYCRPALVRRFRSVLSEEKGDRRDDGACLLEYKAPLAQEINGSLCAGLVDILQDIVPMGCHSGLNPSFSPETTIMALGLDSLGVARLSSRLSTRFSINLSPRILFALRTLGDLESALFGGDAAARRLVLRGPIMNWSNEIESETNLLVEGLTFLRERFNQSVSSYPEGTKALERDTTLLV